MPRGPANIQARVESLSQRHWVFTINNPVEQGVELLARRSRELVSVSIALSRSTRCYTLQLLDIYLLDVEVKGSYRPLLAKRIVVTTNIHPRLWYDYENREEQYNALMRRFTKIWYFPPRACESLWGETRSSSSRLAASLSQRSPVIVQGNVAVVKTVSCVATVVM